ncbi:MAG: GNAT family N-acetyltransferase [Deltaproteobacteria bacterium]|nr:GNAT family N-acetyltransferase [Deltaproteobacteria bacterium]
MPLTFSGNLDRLQTEQVQRDSHAQWGEDKQPEERLSDLFDLIDTFGEAALHLEGLIDRSATVLSSLKRYTYRIATPGLSRSLAAVGLGAVFTHPDHRGCGYAPTLIHKTLEKARNEGFDMALLFSDITPAFYEKCGFMAIPAETAWIALSAVPQAPPLLTRPAAPRDLSRLLSWYESSWSDDWIRVQRQRETWDLMLRINAHPSLLILSDGADELGYVAVREHSDGSLWMDEYCVPHPYRSSLSSRVLATVATLAKNATRIGTWLRPGDDRQGFCTEVRTEAVPMLAVLHPDISLLRSPSDKVFFSPLDHV